MSWEMGRERKTLHLSRCRRPRRPLLPAHTRVTTYNANHANSPRKNSGDTNVMTEPAAPLAERRRREKKGFGPRETARRAHSLTDSTDDGVIHQNMLESFVISIQRAESARQPSFGVTKGREAGKK